MLEHPQPGRKRGLEPAEGGPGRERGASPATSRVRLLPVQPRQPRQQSAGPAERRKARRPPALAWPQAWPGPSGTGWVQGVSWTEQEHRHFLAGLEALGRGDWRGISRQFVPSRTPTQASSQALPTGAAHCLWRAALTLSGPRRWPATRRSTSTARPASTGAGPACSTSRLMSRRYGQAAHGSAPGALATLLTVAAAQAPDVKQAAQVCAQAAPEDRQQEEHSARTAAGCEGAACARTSSEHSAPCPPSQQPGGGALPAVCACMPRC